MTADAPVSIDDIDDGPRHDDELLAANGGQPDEAEHVRRGATPAPGDDGSPGGSLP